jgi:hypothetical protein
MLNVSCVPPFLAATVRTGPEPLYCSAKSVHPESRDTFSENGVEPGPRVKLNGTNLLMPSTLEFGNDIPFEVALTVFRGKNCARSAGVRPTVTQGLQFVTDWGTVWTDCCALVTGPPGMVVPSSEFSVARL